MLRWSIIFMLVAIIAGASGLSGAAGAAAGIAKGLFVVALFLFVVTAIAGIAAGNSLARKLTPKASRREDHSLTHR